MKKIYLASPHVLGNEKKYVNDALDSNWIAPLGEYVDRLEDGIKELTGCGEAVAVASGTAAIHLALIEAGVKEGDKVLCSDMTFTASANPIVYCGAMPVFIDCDDETFNMSPEVLRKAIEIHRPKAVVVASIYGQPAKLDEIRAICDDYNKMIDAQGLSEENRCVLIEDATEVLGATKNGVYAGTFGDYGTFSFNGNKIITTSGGGMLVTKSEKHASHALYMATQAKDKSRYYEHSEIGYNYRLSNVSAAIGVAQLEKLSEKIELKKKIHDMYKEAFAKFKDYGVSVLDAPEDSTSNYWLSVLILNNDCYTTPEEVVDALAREGIEARQVWKPLHTQKTFLFSPFLTQIKDGGSNSEYFFEHALCLPSDTNMTEDDQQRVISIVNTVIHQNIANNYC